VLNSFILEQCSSYIIAQWSSPIRFFPLGAWACSHGCFIGSVSGWHIGFYLEVCLIHPQPFQVSDVYQVLISCCCLTWPNLMVIFQLVITLVNARRAWNFAKISCSIAFSNWAMFSWAVFWFADSSLIDSKPCNYVCLLSLLCMVLFEQPNLCHLNFLIRRMFGNGVMISILRCCDKI
jgi:hypothetical protein